MVIRGNSELGALQQPLAHCSATQTSDHFALPQYMVGNSRPQLRLDLHG